MTKRTELEYLLSILQISIGFPTRFIVSTNGKSDDDARGDGVSRSVYSKAMSQFESQFMIRKNILYQFTPEFLNLPENLLRDYTLFLNACINRDKGLNFRLPLQLLEKILGKKMSGLY